MQNYKGMAGQLEADDSDEADGVCLNPDGPDSVKRCISLETATAEAARKNKRKCGVTGVSCAGGNTEVGCQPPSKQDNLDGRTECRAECQRSVKTTPEMRRLKFQQPDATSDHIRRSGVGNCQSSAEGFAAAGNRHLLGGVGRLPSERKPKILPWNETSTLSSLRGGAKKWQNGTEEGDSECLRRSNESPNEIGSFPRNQTRMRTNITSDMTDSGTNKDPWGNKLFQAVVRNDLNQVRQLCTRRHWKQCLNKIDNSGNTALMLSAEVGLPKMAELLVELGADAELRNDWGETALYVASVSGQLPESALIVRHLVRTAPSTVNVASNNGQTPIFAVAGRCQTETTELILEELIRAGADLNRQGSDDDVYRGRPMTPFELAVTLGNFHHAEMLYEAGCDFLPVLIRYKQLNCYPDSFKTHPTWYNKIRNWTANPKSLKDICGLKITKCMRGENPGELLSVLPSSVVNYLNALSIQS